MVLDPLGADYSPRLLTLLPPGLIDIEAHRRHHRSSPRDLPLREGPHRLMITQSDELLLSTAHWVGPARIPALRTRTA